MIKNSQLKLIITDDGSSSIFVPEIGEHYHSTFGALQESEHVYITTGFHSLPDTLTSIHILEVGFGSGLNALLTYYEAEKKQLKIYYTGIEAFPLPKDIYQKINYPELLNKASCQKVFLSLHDSAWDEPQNISDDFMLFKVYAKLQEFEFENNSFDLVYFDAFSPESQPEMWSFEIFEKIYKAMKSDGLLVTYCVKGIVKQRLRKAGFSIEKLPGPTGKREILRARKIRIPGLR